MTNDQYRALWDVDNDFHIFIVIDTVRDKGRGTIVCASLQQANALLNRNMQLGYYPLASVLVEVVSDNDLN